MLVGFIELLPVRDAVGLLAEYREVYPDVPLDAWEPYRSLYPELFVDDSWRLPCTSYLLRTGDTTVLVDTGVGPPGLWEWTAQSEGELPDALRAQGVAPGDVDIVFLTHLHIDHLGWNCDLDGMPFFPRARYLVHSDALAFARTRPELPHIRRCVESLADRFETIDPDVELVPGVTPFAAPGHYPGQMAVRVRSGDAEALLLADSAVHPALLAEWDWRYVSDLDQPVAAATRHAILPELADRDIVVACGHYPGSGIGRVVTRDGRLIWEETA